MPASKPLQRLLVALLLLSTVRGFALTSPLQRNERKSPLLLRPDLVGTFPCSFSPETKLRAAATSNRANHHHHHHHPDPHVWKGLLSVGQRLADRLSEEEAAKQAILGQNLAILLPLLGGLLAVRLFLLDWHTLCQELRRKRRRRRSLRFYMALILCSGAGLADVADAVIRFGMTYGLAVKRLFHSHVLMVAEEISIACAVVSTLCAMGAGVFCGDASALRGARDQQEATASRLSAGETKRMLLERDFPFETNVVSERVTQ